MPQGKYINLIWARQQLTDFRYYQRTVEQHLAALETIYQTYGYGSHRRHDYIEHKTELLRINATLQDRYDDLTIDQLPSAIRELQKQLQIEQKEPNEPELDIDT